MPHESVAPYAHCTARATDMILNFIFTAEMLLRILALGSFIGYVSQPWNAFDFVMVVAGYSAFIPMGDSQGSAQGVRALRALRALRPLRTITR